MARTSEQQSATPSMSRRADTGWLFAIAVGVATLHLVTNSRYGFHRDELQFLSDARHLDWGYVAYPPLTPLLERTLMSVFGLSLVGLRLFSVIAQAVAVIVSGWMVQEFGGGRLALVTAAIAVAFSPLALFSGTEFQYTSFDFLWWVLIGYFLLRLLKSRDTRWWLAIGAVAGLGLLTKYSILFYIAGILTAFIFTPARRYLNSRHFLVGVTLAFVIFLPNLLWQVNHHFISYRFLHSIHLRDVGQGRAAGFLPDQFRICTNPFAAPLWIAGLVALMRSPRYRPLAWMYLVTLALFLFGQGRGYYTAPLYPMLAAMGAVAGERWVWSLSRRLRLVTLSIYFAGLGVSALAICALILPLATAGRLYWFAVKNNSDLREEFGWPDLVRTVAAVRDTLPEPQREHTGIMVGNYGEQGAIEILGPKYHLPPPISGTNSAWLRGYGASPPGALIVLGFSREDADAMLADCRLAARRNNPLGFENEESRYHADIFICSGPRMGWPEFWKRFQRFG